MEPKIAGFEYQRITVADGVALKVAVGGTGSPIVLLHGFPQTHLSWRHVAVDLAADHTVICPDLRGYGDSDKPIDTDGRTYAKRTMAADIVALTHTLGHECFALAGHDRGALVAFRAGLDHPNVITHLACLDVLPTLDVWETLRGTAGVRGFHLFLMAQPGGLPEQMISAAPDAFFGHFLNIWTRDPDAIPADIRAAYLAASRQAIPSIVADYRASATIDVEDDQGDQQAGSLLQMPLAVLHQDLGPVFGRVATKAWRAWAPQAQLATLNCGHFMAEEAPGETANALRTLLAR
ncbi:alpha/beta fold hydrolase [Nonomuraea sediminis]|uniref:alpha/beta fold hydrolase n=1 Tax=Nonomuraea sediminis TaxID=2835864 RepID=UPI001BDD34CD|nr:alpha/beta hydrolase [Nonomuraea sediminis]